MMTRIIPEYLDFYRPDFHPWQHDNRHLIARHIKKLKQYELSAGTAAQAA
jgi:predicted metal-dependent hydrolase